MKLHELDEPKWDYVMWCVEKQNVGRYLRFFWVGGAWLVTSLGINECDVWAATGDTL